MADEEVPITRKPTRPVDHLAITRDGMKFTGTWKLPALISDVHWDDRYQSINEMWRVSRDNGNGNPGYWRFEDRTYEVTHYGDEHGEWSVTHTSDEIELDRKDYFPLRNDQYLRSVLIQVRGWNERGDQEGYVPAVTYKLEKPRNPSVSDWSFDPGSGYFTATIKSDPGTDNHERYDTTFDVACGDNIAGSKFENAGGMVYFNDPDNGYIAEWYNMHEEEGGEGSWEPIKGYMSSTQTEIQIRVKHAHNSPNSSSPAATNRLKPGEYIYFVLTAHNRGVAGYSSFVRKSILYSYPVTPVIKSGSVTSLEDYGTVNVVFTNFDSRYMVDFAVKPSENATTWVDGSTITLYRMQTTQELPEDYTMNISQWTAVSSVDYDTNGLTDNVADALPKGSSNVDRYVYYAVEFSNGSYQSYSSPFKLDALTVRATTAEDDEVVIESVIREEDGQSLTVLVAWDEDDADGTEVSWSGKENSWRSTEQPSTYEVPNDWKEEQSASADKANSAYVTIYGLTEGEDVYIRARRYKDVQNEDGESTRTYGKYANAPSDSYPVKPSTKPKDVKLKIQKYVERGRAVQARWNYTGSAKQTSWLLYRHEGTGSNERKVLLASGNDAAASVVISRGNLSNFVGTHRLSVSISTGGYYGSSEVETVQVVDKPSDPVMTVSPVLDSQPMAVEMYSERGGADYIVKVVADGMSSVGAGDKVEQLEGDVVWSGRVIPSWKVLPDGGLGYVLVLPMGLPFHDGASYRISVTAVDGNSGLSSNEVERSFTVKYKTQATTPSTSTALTVDKESRSVTIAPAYAQSSLPTDVCDVYRVTPDGYDLVAKGLPKGGSVTDRYAPFGKSGGLLYRVATRTVDGDTAYRDFEYDLYCASIRFDWADGKHLEVPYNLRIDDSFTKDFERTAYMDGSVSGWWSDTVDRTASVNTDMVRLTTREQIDLVRELAEYPGPVFTRFPNGCAFTSNVSVETISESYDSLVLAVSFKISKIDITDEFVLGAKDSDMDSWDAPATPSFVDLAKYSSVALAVGDVYATTRSASEGQAVITGVTLKTAKDKYKGWAGFQSSVDFSVRETSDAFPKIAFALTRIGSEAAQYMSQAAAISGNKFILTITYQLA